MKNYRPGGIAGRIAMKSKAWISVLVLGWLVAVARTQVEKQELKQKTGDIRVVATMVCQTLNGLGEEDEEDVDRSLGSPYLLDGLTIYFQVEGEGHRHLLSARLESVIGLDGKSIPVGHGRGSGLSGEKAANLEMEDFFRGDSLGGNRFKVRLGGEEFSKSSRYLIRGKAKVVVGGTLKKLVVEVDSETCKKIKAEPFQCRYFEEEDNDQGQIEPVGIVALIEGGIYVGALGLCQALSGKGSIFDSISAFYRQQGNEMHDLIKISGPVHHLTSVREGDEKLPPTLSQPGRANFRIPRKKPGKRRITLEYWDGVQEKEIPFEFKGG